MFSQLIQNIDIDKNLEQCQIFDDIYFTSVKNESLAILLSPICDVEQCKVDHFIFCALLPYKYLFFDTLKKEEGLRDINIFDEKLSISKKNKVLGPIKNIVGNRLERFHWLGVLPEQDGYWYVDYQLIQTLPIPSSHVVKGKKNFRGTSTIKPIRIC